MTDRQRFVVIMTIVCGLIFLAGAVALGHVEEKSSYGLTGILLIIGQIVPHVVKNTKTPEPPEEPERVDPPPAPPVVGRGGFGVTGRAVAEEAPPASEL